MNEQEKRQLEREKRALRYMVALEKGDLDSVAVILQQAEEDAELERMILEINDVYAAEMEEAAHAEDEAVVRELLQTHILSALPEAAAEPPP